MILFHNLPKLPCVKAKRPGFIVFPEMVITLIILALLTPVLIYYWRRAQEELRINAVATHFRTILKASEKYINLNHGTLLAASSTSNGPVISLADLRAANCLPDYVGDTNAWQQTYHITARRTTEGDLAGIVMTVGGRGHSEADASFGNLVVPEAAAKAQVGFVPTGLLAPGTVLRGPYAGWEVDLPSLGLANLAVAGHLGMVTTLDSAALQQDFLYRVAVPGHPELNAMQTELDMTDHAIRGVEEIQYVSHLFESMTDFCTTPEDEGRTFLDHEKGLYLCRDGTTRVIGDTGNSLLLQGATLAANGDVIEKPICPVGSATHPEIFVAPSVGAGTTAPDIKALPMHSLQAWAVEHSDTEWQVFLRILNSDEEWIYPPSDYGRMIVLTSCARD